MGKIITDNNKVKFEVKDKQDCKLYLGHVMEYTLKKREIYFNLFSNSLQFLANELKTKQGINFGGDEEVLKFVAKNKDTDFNFELDFHTFKLFNSAISLVKNEIINVIGDFSKDKIAISYNNYLDIIKKNHIPNVVYKNNKNRTQLIDIFNTNRNYVSHFSSDKLCEWIEYREKQVKEFDAKIEHDENFNIYISDTLSYKTFVEELLKNYVFLNLLNEILAFMQEDFEDLIGKKVVVNIIKKEKFDESIEKISENGFKSHELSKKRKQK